VNCIKAPCLPIKQTYNNRCLAEKVNALNIVEGECKTTSRNEFLEVSTPSVNQKISSPFTVKGRVLSPWLSEGVAPVQITDQNGKVLGSGQVKGSTDWMTRSGWMDFETNIVFNKGDAKNGFVVFKKDNPSGKPENDQTMKIAVEFVNVVKNDNCTKEFKPVCGQMQPRCLVEPCLPIQQTYSNRCMAEKAGVEKIIEGECKKNPQEFIKIQALKAGDLVASPLVIKAEARGMWFFEGSFPIVVTDKSGALLGTGVAQAVGEWMTENFVPFTAKIDFKKTAATEGYVIFRNDNPSGDIKTAMELKIPVKFTAAPGGICTTIYKPVCGEKKEDSGSFPTVKTYSNRCVAEKEGATNITEGACEKPKEVACQIGGCNRELCSEEALVSTCIAKPEFACYRTAMCEVQKNGACAWTQTAALNKCLDDARKTTKASMPVKTTY
jgi:hypothetical protein